MILVNLSIWKAIYQEEESIGGIQFRMLMTYIILSFLIQSIFMMDEYMIDHKVRTGLISSDLLKPISFRLYIFSYNIGALFFRIIMQLIPALIISVIFFGLLPPFSAAMALYFVISVVLGYLVLYSINFIVWITCFWFFGTFSLVTIKDAAVMILSGALLPLWFMPQWLVEFIEMTPFKSIYYIPVSIYLGYIPRDEIFLNIIIQAVWVLILFAVGHVMWKTASKKLVVQGG